MNQPELWTITLLGGFVPALFWLWFWLKEDREEPEPFKRVLLCFLGGVIAVPLVLPFQKYIFDNIMGGINLPNLMLMDFRAASLGVFLWVIPEEIFKFGAAWFGGLSKKENDEPIDSLIYMIAAAVGFSAMENTFFLTNSIMQGNILDSIITGNLRFIGPTLLHISASATIGVMLALSFYKRRGQKAIYLLFGFILAIIAHFMFNVIIMAGDKTMYAYLSFLMVWVAIITLIFIFEKIKSITRTK